MIAYLKGKVVVSKIGSLILETNGVGYKIAVSPTINLKNGSLAEFFVFQQIREDCNDLYGFKTYDELELFEKLISVNGIGPKAGINIMAIGDSTKIISAIANEDISFFISVPGIGKKAATKIIVDLKSKITSDKSLNVLEKASDSEDIIDALMALGYKKPEIMSMILELPKGLNSTEEMVTWCLKNIK
jgi:Holliday junction DNA helicase RuvA